MKTLKHYLAESDKTYEFRVRCVTEMSDDQFNRLKTHLLKYNVENVSAPKKTIMQKSPYGFAEFGPAEVYIIDITTKLPITANIMHEEVAKATGIPMQSIVVHSKLESEEFWNEKPEKETEPTSVLADADYKDSPKVKHEDNFGNDFVAKFIKNLPKSEQYTEYKVK
jgi:hypothetical protein